MHCLSSSAAGIGAIQPGLAREAATASAHDESTPPPPPAVLRALTLGYHAAAADVLWAKVVSDYGQHRARRITAQLDAILSLCPDYAPLFHYAPLFLVFPRGDAAPDPRAARAYLERGLAARPRDIDLWRQYGRFLAYTGPSFLASEEEKTRWREAGARALEHADSLARP